MGFGAFMFARSLTQDVRNVYRIIEENIAMKSSQSRIFKHITDAISVHAFGKELSTKSEKQINRRDRI